MPDGISPDTPTLKLIANTPTTLKNPLWQDLIPLMPTTNPEIPYPIDALPTTLRESVITYQNYGQQPLSLIACSALANISLACQTLANVARDNYLISPISLYFIVVANSGERKTAADNVFSRAIRAWEEKVRQERLPKIKLALTQHKAWEMQKKGLLAQIKHSMVNGVDTDFFSNLLERLTLLEPTIPLLPTLYFQDTTQEALALHLATGWASAALWSDEAASILGNHSMQANPMRFVALLNSLWDGKNFIAHRKTSQSFNIQDRRLTLNLMMQPILLQQMLGKSANINRHSGFLARCLLAYPISTMGQRFYQEPPKTLDCLIKYESCIMDCLNQSQHLTISGCKDLPILQMSTRAKQQWTSFFNNIELGLKPNGQWSGIKDFASKASENIIRLAALLHLFAGKEGNISTENIEQAIYIIHWHLQETRRLLASQTQNKELIDATKLLEWLLLKGTAQITIRTIQRLSHLRDKLRLENALTILTEHNYIKIIKDGNSSIIALNPICINIA